MKNSHKIATVMWVIWGIVHAVGGAFLLINLFDTGAAFILSRFSGSDVPASVFPADIYGLAGAIYSQHAWNLIWIGLLAIVVAILLNWKNSTRGFWFNLALISCADMGQVLFLQIPGYIGWLDASIGPILWILGAIFAIHAYRNNDRTS